MNTEQLWASDFGTAYTARNRVDWQKRVPFWRSILDQTNPRSAVEFGCNAGWNLRAIRSISEMIPLIGVDVNEEARLEAVDAGFSVLNKPITETHFLKDFDLAFTAGVLIHVQPADLGDAMDAIIRASRRHVLAVEYAADKETEIPYRGQRDALWKRPFGAMYEAKGLKLIDQGFVSKSDGFDDCTYWLMQKP